MRIDEIISPALLLNEDAREASEINLVAKYLEQVYLKFKDKISNMVTLSLDELNKHITNGAIPLPKISSPTLTALLLEPSSDREVLEFGFNHPRIANQQAYGEFMASLERPRILINADMLLAHKKSMSSTVAHEIQHALDLYKSKGLALSKTNPKTADNQIDYDAYLKQPDEINARFAQALMDIAQKNATVGKSQATTVIAQSLNAYQLTKAIVGEQGYKRLLSRAYKFIDDMNMLATERKKPGFVDKIKGLIKRLIS
jgi:hypothetical protein